MIRSESGCRGKWIVVELEWDWRGFSGIERWRMDYEGVIECRRE